VDKLMFCAFIYLY